MGGGTFRWKWAILIKILPKKNMCIYHTAQLYMINDVIHHPCSSMMWMHRTVLYSKWCTGWRRLIGCLKVQVTFRKRATNDRALLREMTHKDKASYDSTPPCIYINICTHHTDRPYTLFIVQNCVQCIYIISYIEFCEGYKSCVYIVDVYKRWASASEWPCYRVAKTHRIP